MKINIASGLHNYEDQTLQMVYRPMKIYIASGLKIYKDLHCKWFIELWRSTLQMVYGPMKIYIASGL